MSPANSWCSTVIRASCKSTSSATAARPWLKFALKILAAMPDGTGAVMIDGKMQDDATWKQAKVVVDLAKIVAGKDAEMKERYGV